MHHWTKRLFAIAAPLFLTGCLWGPGKFNSDLTIRKDGSFVLDYRGELVLQLPPDANAEVWTDAKAKCRDGEGVWPSRSRRSIQPGIRGKADEIRRLAVGDVPRERGLRRRLSPRGAF